MIFWKLCKKMKFNHTDKLYMHNSETVLENETYKILWDFEIQMDHRDLGQMTRLTDSQKKYICRIVNIVVPGIPMGMIEKHRKERQVPGSC